MKSKYEIVLKNNKPHGIRNEDGFLLFFPDITKYLNQEERYKEELVEQFSLADYIKLQLETKQLL